MKLCLFVNYIPVQLEMNGAKIQLFTQQLKYFKHFFSMKVIFFYQKAIFTHILLTTSLYVQLLSSHFKRQSTRQSIKICNIYHIDLQ